MRSCCWIEQKGYRARVHVHVACLQIRSACLQPAQQAISIDYPYMAPDGQELIANTTYASAMIGERASHARWWA